MSFLGFHPCEKCGSSDANAEYENSFYCFSCATLTRKGGKHLKRLDALKEVRVCNGISLTKELPTEAKKWLLGYGLTPTEIGKFSYAKKRQGKYGLMDCSLLVLYHSDTYWCARNFGKGVKYLSSGEKPFVTYGDNPDTMVLVEDIISAIKVGRQFTATPMLGSMPHKDTATHLQGFKNVCLWPDFDKRLESLKSARNLSEKIGVRVKIILTEKDPKEYSDLDISSYIYN